MTARLIELSGHLWFWVLVLAFLMVVAVAVLEVVLRWSAHKSERELQRFIQREMEASARNRMRRW